MRNVRFKPRMEMAYTWSRRGATATLPAGFMGCCHCSRLGVVLYFADGCASNCSGGHERYTVGLQWRCQGGDDEQPICATWVDAEWVMGTDGIFGEMRGMEGR